MSEDKNHTPLSYYVRAEIIGDDVLDHYELLCWAKYMRDMFYGTLKDKGTVEVIDEAIAKAEANNMGVPSEKIDTAINYIQHNIETLKWHSSELTDINKAVISILADRLSALVTQNKITT